ncbi:MAG: hypothetical protein AAF483_18465 [Planctomycetota bacterium]
MKLLKYFAVACLLLPAIGCADPNMTPVPPENTSQSPVTRQQEGGGDSDTTDTVEPVGDVE